MGKREVRSAHQQARKVIDRYVDRSAMPGSMDQYGRVHGDIVRALGRAGRGQMREEMTRRTGVRMAEMVSREIARSTQAIANELGATSGDASMDALRGLSRFIRQVSGEGSAVDEESTVQRVASGITMSAEERHRRVMAQVASEIELEVRREIAVVVIEQGTVRDAISAVDEVIDRQRWRIERAVRTQASAEYNEAVSRGIDEISREDPKVKKRWTELVNDLTGAPLDKRVGQDSLVLHGQIARDGLFTMPPVAGAPAGMVGLTWAHPPNRPYDRAVLTPWAPGWGVPAWRWDGSRKRTMGR